MKIYTMYLIRSCGIERTMKYLLDRDKAVLYNFQNLALRNTKFINLNFSFHLKNLGFLKQIKNCFK